MSRLIKKWKYWSCFGSHHSPNSSEEASQPIQAPSARNRSVPVPAPATQETGNVQPEADYFNSMELQNFDIDPAPPPTPVSTVPTPHPYQTTPPQQSTDPQLSPGSSDFEQESPTPAPGAIRKAREQAKAKALQQGSTSAPTTTCTVQAAAGEERIPYEEMSKKKAKRDEETLARIGKEGFEQMGMRVEARRFKGLPVLDRESGEEVIDAMNPKYTSRESMAWAKEQRYPTYTPGDASASGIDISSQSLGLSTQDRPAKEEDDGEEVQKGRDEKEARKKEPRASSRLPRARRYAHGELGYKQGEPSGSSVDVGQQSSRLPVRSTVNEEEQGKNERKGDKDGTSL
ncbi:hypothetical protein K402DRAFT_424259 [Aulographum hederae CBS 113979]|uniref:Uncharacterized protein n=1 Tax=Aulographum hederae CBS 113979 TaxID=1176131 RepID=A0A6G1GPJ8_9PEZI|nr:hypothetical protein K402DRAFT_424259 [Aulographum hederae CBS 113979]